MSADIEKLLAEIDERTAKIRVLLSAKAQLTLFPDKRPRARVTPSVPTVERDHVAVFDFRELWSEARRASHYMKPWLIPQGSEQEKKLLEVARVIQQKYPHHADQTFYATCEKYFACEEPFIVSTKHCLELFCSRFNQFLVFMPKVEYSSDGSKLLKAGYTGSGQWVEPQVLVVNDKR